MRDHREDDPKKPQPVRSPKKNSNPADTAEPSPWQPIGHGRGRDWRHHV